MAPTVRVVMCTIREQTQECKKLRISCCGIFTKHPPINCKASWMLSIVDNQCLASLRSLLNIFTAAPRLELPEIYTDGLIFRYDEVIRLKVPFIAKPPPRITWLVSQH